MGEVEQAIGNEVMQMWKPKGVGLDPPSTTPRVTVLKIHNKPDKMTVPVMTNTKVFEVKGLLSFKLGVDPSELRFCHKQGSVFRNNLDHEEVAREVVVYGIRSFHRERQEYPHPHCIIGAGHLGLKTAMIHLRYGMTNFVLFDRRDKVGGTSWWQQANVSSRLQTEVGVYHLEFDTMNGWPADAEVNPWPTRNQLLERFMKTAEDFGVMPYCQMETNVTRMNVIGKDYWSSYYELAYKGVNADMSVEETMLNVASICFYPGNLTNPKRVIYKGEEMFGGDIVYGISSLFDYTKCKDNNTSIIGCGAFAVENVRTCVEQGSKMIYLICRRRNMAMPRVVSWLINQSERFISAALTIVASEPMYDLMEVDPWAYYCVYANEARTQVTMRQKCRFGIGDVYFLSSYYGICETVVDDVKRVTFQKIHLVSGRILDDVTAMLKLLGFNGEFENDRLLKMKEIFGFWCNKDYKRYLVAEPIGVDANNFGGTSFSPGALGWGEMGIYFLYFPKDFQPLIDGGFLPSHVADESIDRPAYVVEARHGALTSIASGMVQGLQDIQNAQGWLSRTRMWQMHPVDKFLLAAEKEWNSWSKMIQAHGFTKPHPPYPYTVESVQALLGKEKQENEAADAAMMKRMQRS